ncbi:MAG: metallophosphoesterase [Bacteroidota bacterium]|nr:metallophosphoesterase [Bacteroidota bacterium]
MFKSVITLIPISVRIFFSVIFVLVFDFYAYQAIKVLTEGLSKKVRQVIKYTFWILSIAFYILALLAMGGYLVNANRTILVVVSGLFFAMFVAKILMIFPLLIEDIYRLIHKITSFFRGNQTSDENTTDKKGLISRKKFISQISAGIGTLTFSGLSYGIIKGAHDYKLHQTNVTIKNLPEALKGLKIGHLSDIHSGSFWDQRAVEKGIQMLMSQKPDLIFFTGDLVNSLSEEMSKAYIEIFSKVKARLGVFSILGNHDYGDYHQWPDRNNEHAMNGNLNNKSHMSPMQIENLDRLHKIHAQMGWQLLLNENKVLDINGEKLAIIGVENYGVKGRFPKYGNLAEAYQGTEAIQTKLLLSHDPSHWDAQVRTNTFKDIAITFSGHTHGAQFGIETANFRWSPVKYMYKQWAGLYQEGEQYLYVNRGFGYLGYPGRLGIRPEVAVIKLV